ncbi:transposase IS1400, partial [Pelistega indica]
MGYPWNHKRVYRVYTQLKLNLKSKRKQRLPVREPLLLQTPERANQCWSMDFMSDSLENQVRFRTLNVIDDYNRQALGIQVSVGMPTGKVIDYLDRLAELYGYPERIRVDNGTEFTSHRFVNWAKQHGIYIDYIQPGCPYQNGFIL